MHSECNVNLKLAVAESGFPEVCPCAPAAGVGRLQSRYCEGKVNTSPPPTAAFLILRKV